MLAMFSLMTTGRLVKKMIFPSGLRFVQNDSDVAGVSEAFSMVFAEKQLWRKCILSG
jgi:hypothetical protein